MGVVGSDVAMVTTGKYIARAVLNRHESLDTCALYYVRMRRLHWGVQRAGLDQCAARISRMSLGERSQWWWGRMLQVLVEEKGTRELHELCCVVLG